MCLIPRRNKDGGDEDGVDGVDGEGAQVRYVGDDNGKDDLSIHM